MRAKLIYINTVLPRFQVYCVMRFTSSMFSSAVSTEPLADQWPALGAATLSMLAIGLVSALVTPGIQPLLLVASSGASIILIFILPNSPVSQPYPLIMGHLICATVGVSCALLPVDINIQAALCILACLLAMVLLDCLHPPGGATGLMPVIVGADAVGTYTYIFFPVLVNMLVLLILGILFHRYCLKKEYPSQASPLQDPIHRHKDASPLTRLGISHKDLDAALKVYDAQLNITEKDLSRVYGLAQQNAYARKFGEVRCKDIMSRDVVTVERDTELE